MHRRNQNPVAKCCLLYDMTPDAYGQPIYNEQDLFDLAMKGQSHVLTRSFLVDSSVDLSRCADLLTEQPTLIPYQPSDISREEFDRQNQQCWLMPEQYQQMDIAEHVLGLCTTSAELQRCGHELLMYQERGMFDLLKYMVYLVDVMRQNGIIWGVGRGSSVASFVLYKLGVHRINSLYYDLDPSEFLR